MSIQRTATIVLALLLFPTALAGTSQSPEISDAADAAEPYLDVTRAWITHDETYVHFTLKLRDLAIANPIENGDYRAYYRVDFTLPGAAQTFSAAARVDFVETTSLGSGTPAVGAIIGPNSVSTGVGTHALNSNTRVAVDLDADTVRLSYIRANPLGNGGAFPIADGMVIGQIQVFTEAGEDLPHESAGLFAVSEARRLVDSTASASYVVA